MSFGSNVRFYRIQKGLRLEDLSKMLDVSINYLSLLEQDKAKMYPSFLPNLCEALDVDIHDLYTYNEQNVFNKKNVDWFT